MDAGEGIASPEEHQISISSEANPDEAGEPNTDEDWIKEVEGKITSAYEGSKPKPNQRSSNAKEETEPKIRKLSPRNRQPKLETEDGLSQPSVVAIGPFHRGRDEVSISDNDKRVIVGLMNQLCDLDTASCLVKIKNQVANARSSYELDEPENSSFKDDKSFAEMLLLDGYFILFMLITKLRKGPSGNTLMLRTPNELTERPKLPQDYPSQCFYLLFNKDKIALDLLIFDNQIPFFVIEELFMELKWEKSLLEYALKFFKTIHPRSTILPRFARHIIEKNRSPKFLHLLHLFHWSRVPQNKYNDFWWPDKELNPIYWISDTPNAMELNRESATVFEKKMFSNSLEITFRTRWCNRIIGVLNIPELHIRAYSSLIFHNLITFEMQSQSRGRCTMAFSAFMRNLLQSEEDVKLLRRRGILANTSMSDGELVDFFKRLSRLIENYQMPTELFEIYDQVHSHHNRRMSRFCGSIILQYFPNPLVTLSVFAAVLLFVLTLLQTIYTILGYYR